MNFKEGIIFDLDSSFGLRLGSLGDCRGLDVDTATSSTDVAVHWFTINENRCRMNIGHPTPVSPTFRMTDFVPELRRLST